MSIVRRTHELSLLSPPEEPQFNSGAVRPFACLGGGWHLIKDQYFPFAYQLAVDRNLSGWQATKLSARAARANFGGVLGLLLLEMIPGGIGVVLCCIGLAFVLPLTKGAWTIAYRQVFPALPPEQFAPMPFPPPPPPPPFPTPGRN